MKDGGMEGEGRERKGKGKENPQIPPPRLQSFLLRFWGAGLEVSPLYGVLSPSPLPCHPGKTGMLSEPAVLLSSQGLGFAFLLNSFTLQFLSSHGRMSEKEPLGSC